MTLRCKYLRIDPLKPKSWFSGRCAVTPSKLKQASAVLGMPTKELQNLVQFGVVKPRRRRGLYFFDTSCLYQAQVAGHLKLTLGTPANKLAEFVAAFAEFLKKGEAQIPDVLVFRSSSKYSNRPVEVRLSFKQLRETLETRLQRVDLYRDLPRGRKRPNWRAEFLNTLKEASQDIGDRRKAVGTMATAVVSGRHRMLGAQVERLAGGQKAVLRGDPHPIAVDDCHRRGLGRARRDVDDQPEQPSLLDQRQHLAEVIVMP